MEGKLNFEELKKEVEEGRIEKVMEWIVEMKGRMIGKRL